jgi:hypothetical protein
LYAHCQDVQQRIHVDTANWHRLEEAFPHLTSVTYHHYRATFASS